MDFIMHFIRCFYVPSWSLPQGWQLFQHAEGNPIWKDQPLTKNERWWGAEIKKKAGRQDIISQAAWVGRRREGQPLSKYSSLQDTKWKQRNRSLGKDNPGRYLQAGEFMGTLRKAPCALMSELHPPCSLQGLHAVTARDCWGGCIALSASSRSKGKAENCGSSLSFCQ